jgi:hypothetical protein
MLDADLLVVAAVIGMFIVAALVLVAFAARRREPVATRTRPALGMSAGMLFGAALGVIVWLSTGEFVFWVIFLGGGLVVGLALGSASTSKAR